VQPNSRKTINEAQNLEDLSQKLRQYIKIGTPAERRIAKYFSEHLNELPFETASSVADRLELSPMTVGRFLRSLGYHGLDGIKVHLKENAPTITSQLPNILEQLQKDASEGHPLATQIAEQVETMGLNYMMAYLFFGTMQLSDALRSLELFRSEVMPKFA